MSVSEMTKQFQEEAMSWRRVAGRLAVERDQAIRDAELDRLNRDEEEKRNDALAAELVELRGKYAKAIKERDEAREDCRYEEKRRMAAETHNVLVEGERDSAREALREAWREIRKRDALIRKSVYGEPIECAGLDFAAKTLESSSAKAGVKLGEDPSKDGKPQEGTIRGRRIP